MIWFGAVYGSGYEERLDDVTVDPDRRLVYAELVVADVHQA